MRFEQVPHRRTRSAEIVDKAALPVREVFRFPGFWANNHLISETTFNLDATTDKVAVIYRAYKTGEISSIVFGSRSGVVTTPNVVYRASIQTVTAAASTSSFPQPSGTVWATNTEVLITHNSLRDCFYFQTLTAPASVVVGDYFAVVFEYSSGTPDGSNYLKIGLEAYPVQTGLHGFPIAMTNTGGGWTKASNQLPILGFSYNKTTSPSIEPEDDTYSSAPIGLITTGDVTLTSTGSHNLLGSNFVQFIDGTINGCLFVARFASENTPFDVELWQAPNTLQTTWDRGATYITGISFNSGTVSSDWSTDQYLWLPFPETKLRAGEHYSLIVEATSTTAIYARVLHHNYENSRNLYSGASWVCTKTLQSLPTPAGGSPGYARIGDTNYTGFCTPLFKQTTNRRYW